MIHIIKSGEFDMKKPMLCGIRAEELPRKDAFVDYRNRAHTDCPAFLEIMDITERMRKGNK